MAGIACARQLARAGWLPTVFEKSRGLGGRLATRRLQDGLAFDHGAQYLTARTPAFRAVVAELVAAGAAARWRPRLREADLPEREDWVVGSPAMNALLKPLAVGLDVRLGTRIAQAARENGGWRLHPAGGAAESFDIVVSTAPAPQAKELFAGEAGVAETLAEVAMAPCWTLMLAFETAVAQPTDLYRSDRGDLAWICRNAARPGRNAAPDGWIVQASADWSERHLDCSAEHVAALLAERFAAAMDETLPPVGRCLAHRWRYARVTRALGRPFVAAADDTLFLGGDWCLGARIECAFESGTAIARALGG